MKRPEPNPDRIKYHNDAKKKKLTIRHLEQRIDNELKYLAQLKGWMQRDKERIFEQEAKIANMQYDLMCLKINRSNNV